jgi:sugar phosphate isomerase/epimerase
MQPGFTRRTFFGGAAGAGLGLAGGLPAASQPEDIKLGVCTYSVREFSRANAIRMIRQLNVRNVTIKEFHLPYRSTPEELARGVQDFEKAGLSITGGGVIYLLKNEDDDIRFYFDYAKRCRMPLMVVGATQENVRRIERFVKEYGIRVAIHNHGPEDKHFPSPEVALKALHGLDGRMGVSIDVGHTVRTGTSAVQSIRNAGPRLFDLHIKDLRDLRDKDSQVAVGDGAMPVIEIFQELRKMKYQGVVHLEYEVDGFDPLPGMAKSFSYMRGALAGLRG